MKEVNKLADSAGYEMGFFVAILIAAVVSGGTLAAMGTIAATAFGNDKLNHMEGVKLMSQVKKSYGIAHEKYLRIRNYGNVYK